MKNELFTNDGEKIDELNSVDLDLAFKGKDGESYWNVEDLRSANEAFMKRIFPKIVE